MTDINSMTDSERIQAYENCVMENKGSDDFSLLFRFIGAAISGDSEGAEKAFALLLKSEVEQVGGDIGGCLRYLKPEDISIVRQLLIQRKRDERDHLGKQY